MPPPPTLFAAPKGHYIVLEFREQFHIEEAGADCDNDKIEIRDGRYGMSKVLARYCGQQFPPDIKSSGDAMWLRFVSDASITHTGFKAIYRFEKQKCKLLFAIRTPNLQLGIRDSRLETTNCDVNN